MTWKRVIQYFLILILLSLIAFIFLMNRDLVRIYGGLTKKVDHEQFSRSAEKIAITNVHVLTADSRKFRPAQTVHIDNGLIVSIDSMPPSPGDIKIIDGSGKFLIPGLIDSHVHLFKSPNDLLLYVANGITHIREMIGEENHLLWREQIIEGRLGPDMYIASPRVGSFGRIEGWFMRWSQGFNTINNEADAKVLLQEYANQGYDGVKIYSQLNKESYQAINEIAPSVGLTVVGHIPWSIELTDLWNSNQKEVSHLEELMNALRREFGSIDGEEDAGQFLNFVDDRSKELAVNLFANNVAVTTTLWLTESFVRQKFYLDEVLAEVKLEYENPGISEWNERIPQGLGWLPLVNRYKMPDAASLSSEDLENRKVFWTVYAEACQLLLKNIYQGGVMIMAGTDANLPPAVPGFSLHDELESMHAAGMTT